MGRRGPKPLPADVKAIRGTLRPYRERQRTPQTDPSDPETTPSGTDYLAVANRYRADVLSGRIVTGQLVRLACERQERDLTRTASPSWPYRWSDEHAIDICAFAQTLPHVEGRWATPLIRLEPWQVFILTTLFG